MTELRPSIAVRLLDEEREVCIRALDLLLGLPLAGGDEDTRMQRRVRGLARDLRARLRAEMGTAR